MKKNMEHVKVHRTYPARPCANPACTSAAVFAPRRRNQKYCCEQCRVNFNNDRRHQENSTTYRETKTLKLIDVKLKKLYGMYADAKGRCVVMKELLFHEGINVMLQVSALRNPVTKRIVKVYFEYGIELTQDENFFIIHKI